MQLSNTIKTLVLTTLLSPWLAFAGNGLEDGNPENDVTPPGGGNDTGISNPTPGIFFDAVNEADAVWEWNLGVGKAGDNILCTRSYDDDTRAVGSYRDSFCIMHEAPQNQLFITGDGLVMGGNVPQSYADLTITDMTDSDNWTMIGLVNDSAEDGNGVGYTQRWWMGHVHGGSALPGTDGRNEWFAILSNNNGSDNPMASGLIIATDVADGALILGPDYATNYVDLGNTNVLLGDWTPQEAVDVLRSAEAARFQLTSHTDTTSEAAQFIQRRARGNYQTPLPVRPGDNLGLFSFRGYNGSSFTGSKAAITVQATEAWTGSANGTKILFGTTENGTTSLQTRMEITHDGHIKVGGTQLNVPDYVFEEDYELMSLEDLDAYVKEQHHLPDVPSEATIRAEGLNVTKTQMLLLKKIEELTLYTIQQQEQFLQQQEEIKKLKRTVSILSEGNPS